MSLTVSNMSSRLGNLMDDPNEEVFTSALKLDALNDAQKELVLKLLSFGSSHSHIYDALNEIMVKETFSNVTAAGFNLNNTVSRNFLRNGFVNASIIDDDGNKRWCTRITTDKLGVTQNQYMAGSTTDPKVNITSNNFELMVDVGSYPKDVTCYYVGEPYTMAASASGSGKTQVVAICDLNPVMHDLLVLMAEAQLRRLRGTERDTTSALALDKKVTEQIIALARGAKVEVQENTPGQYGREKKKKDE